MFLDVSARLARQLLQLARQFGSVTLAGVRVDHGLTQQALAGVVSASRETVNKALAEFVHRGWINTEDGSGQVLIIAPHSLARRSKLPTV